MRIINNKGQGNCMYYAYAISLMYHLRAQNEDDTQAILGRLELDNEQLRQLLEILKQPQSSQKIFNQTSLDSIQAILGPVLRKIASSADADMFKEGYGERTQLYANAAYFFRQVIVSEILNLPEPTNHILENAEIFKVPDMKKKMANFVQTKCELIFQEGQEITLDIVDDLVHKTTMLFFNDNNYENLDLYSRFLNTNTIWGSEESLLALNRALCDEKMHRADDEKIEWIVAQSIKLSIHANGCPKSGDIDNPDIILENWSNNHWVSRIPDKYAPSLNLFPLPLKGQPPVRQPHHHYPGLFLGGMLGAATWAMLHQTTFVTTVASLLATGNLPATLALGLGLMILGAILGYLVSLASKDIISNRATSMATA